jgi:predicted N-acetyltransferase YhbS
MSNLIVRLATPTDLEQIYMMGFDVWAEGSKKEYLKDCRNSPKYQKGTWYVLTDDSQPESQVLSSLIIYDLPEGHLGLASLATAKAFRKRGYASHLMSQVLVQLEKQRPAKAIFLYSEIQPEFYEKFNFAKLPKPAQRYKSKTCMVRCQSPEDFSKKLTAPEFF